MNFTLNAHYELSQKIGTLGIHSWIELTQFVRSLPYGLNTSNFDGVFQYGSDYKEERRCCQDGIAPQIGVNASGLVPNIFIPEAKESIRNFLDAHYIDNYDWLFTDFDAKQTITKRNP